MEFKKTAVESSQASVPPKNSEPGETCHDGSKTDLHLGCSGSAGADDMRGDGAEVGWSRNCAALAPVNTSDRMRGLCEDAW